MGEEEGPSFTALWVLLGSAMDFCYGFPVLGSSLRHACCIGCSGICDHGPSAEFSPWCRSGPRGSPS